MISTRSKTIIFILLVLAVFAVACAVLPGRIAAAAEGDTAKAGAARNAAKAGVTQTAANTGAFQTAANVGAAQAAATNTGTPQGTAANTGTPQTAATAAAQQEEDPLLHAAPLPPKAFRSNKPQLKLNRCRSTARGIRMQWEILPGAEGYQVYRAETPDGEFELFGETEEPSFSGKTDGSYCYKVRAVRGNEKSRWSVTVQISCVIGYVDKVYYDDNGFTHFRCTVSNRTDESVWFYGQGLSRANSPDYHLQKTNAQTREKLEDPYPLTAAISTRPGRSIVIPAHTETKDIDIYIPSRISRLGESGMSDEAFYYQLLANYYPRGEAPAFELQMAERGGSSKSIARIVR